MNKTEFFVLVADYIDSVKTANETKMAEDRNRMYNLFLKIKAQTEMYGEQARKKLQEIASHQVAVQELKDKLDLVKTNEEAKD